MINSLAGQIGRATYSTWKSSLTIRVSARV